MNKISYIIIILILIIITILINECIESKHFTNNGKNNKRILLTDKVFPSKFAKWRLVEIHSFIHKYDTDILVINRTNNFSNIEYTFDYDNLYIKFLLNQYDILIFNPEFNYINKYNDDYFDGKIFNKLLHCDYLFRKKKFRNTDFNINDYDAIYHIFLTNYNIFNLNFNYPHNNQYIHLYPGGGLTINMNEINTIDKNTNIISTQYFISDALDAKGFTYHNIFGGPFFYKNDTIKLKLINNNNLNVCFTSLGDIYQKGADKYIELVNLYHNKYNNNSNNINFISIGNCPDNQYITKINPLPQDQLSDYYYNNIDVYINLDSGVELHGFPLGVEAGIEGCILLTTDIHNANIKNNFNFDNFLIIDRNNLDDIITKLIKLCDITFRKKLSIYIQNKLFDLFSYNSYMKHIFQIIDNDY